MLANDALLLVDLVDLVVVLLFLGLVVYIVRSMIVRRPNQIASVLLALGAILSALSALLGVVGR